MVKIMITGYNGFVGRHLVRELYKARRGSIEVIGIDKTIDSADNLPASVEECNFLDFANVFEIIKKYSPEVIFHFAAESSVASSWHSPSFMVSNNVNSQINLFEALRKLDKLKTRVIIAGSSEEYGEVDPEMLPASENCAFRPLSSYAVSKIAQDMTAFQYFKSYGMDVIRVRCFNLCGPGQLSKYVLSSFARQTAQIEASGARSGVIKVGNLEIARDYTDVRDASNYYIELAEKAVSGEVYNLCSGKIYYLKDLLNILIKKSKIDIRVETDPEKLRPSDLKLIYGDNSKLNALCNYRPRYNIETTLTEMLDYWRENIS